MTADLSSSWGQRICKAWKYASRGDLNGLASETRQFWAWKQATKTSLRHQQVSPIGSVSGAMPAAQRSAPDASMEFLPPQIRKEISASYTSTEFLVPQIRKEIVVEEFPFITAHLDNPSWSEESLRAKINELGSWEYYFAFAHGLTTEICGTFDQRSSVHHRFRSKLISETVIDLLGDDVGHSTVVDLACHCGILSLDIASRGAKSVLGIELREKNLRQARFLKEYYGITNVAFEKGDVYELEDISADVIVCAGILYHVVRPVDLIEFCYRNSRKFAVVDTNCRRDPISAYYAVLDKDPSSAIEGTRSIEFLPTYRAVIDTMCAAGFEEIVEVIGVSSPPVFLYSDYTRRCLIGFKEKGSLTQLQSRGETWVDPKEV